MNNLPFHRNQISVYTANRISTIATTFLYIFVSVHYYLHQYHQKNAALVKR